MQKCIFAQLNIFLWKMYAKMHFCIKCIFASNIFLQSIKCILASNAFLHQMHFCTAEHFPKENVMLNIFQRKMYAKIFLHQMHFCTALLNIFPLENVQHQQNVMLCFALLCKNTFLHQIHFCTAFVFCCAKNTAASNTFLHCLCFLLCKKHSSIKYICNILLC